MARSFTGGASQFLDRSSIISGYPYTISAWACPANLTDAYRGITQAATTGVGYAQLALRGDVSGDPVEYYIDDGSVPSVTCSVAGYTAGAWNFVAARSASLTDHAAWLNSAKGTSSTSRAFPTTSKFSICKGYYAGTAYYDAASSRWAHVAIWSVALSDAEVGNLAAGFCPLLVRPASLIAYYPLGGFHGDYDRDLVGGYHLTSTNSPTFADQPRIIYPVGPHGVQLAASAPAASKFRRSLFLRSGSRGVL